ncbi:SDR family NAD(P)-dependent oxidoreductase [Chloroflexota bacterium]
MGISSVSLEGKVAIVTGGKKGIGKAIALAFAGAGADVAVCTRVLNDGVDNLEAVAEEIRRLGRRSLAIQTDVSVKSEVDNLVQKVMDEFGVIDILVNNAGIFSVTPWLKLNEDKWDTMIDTNLKSCYLCCHAVGKRMVEWKKGNIINMASVAAFNSAASAYSVSKAGIVMLTRGLARELGQYNIRVNAIAPGLTNTDMIQFLWRGDPERIKQMEAGIPQGRLGETSDITSAALFLASEASSYVTGHTITIDGGSMA